MANDVERLFGSQAVDENQKFSMDLFKMDFVNLARRIDHYEDCREKSIALRKLEEALFYTNKMIAFSKVKD